METLSNSKQQFPKDRGKLKKELDDKIANLEKELAESCNGVISTYEFKEKSVASSYNDTELEISKAKKFQNEVLIKDTQRKLEEVKQKQIENTERLKILQLKMN